MNFYVNQKFFQSHLNKIYPIELLPYMRDEDDRPEVATFLIQSIVDVM